MERALLIGSTWSELEAEVHATLWSGWARLEPDLVAVAGVAGLRTLVEDRAPSLGGKRDRVLAALLRLGAASGRDVHDAAVLVGAVMNPAAVRVAVGLRRQGVDEPFAVVAGALWEVVRTAPVDRWRRAVPVRLKWEIHRAAQAAASGERLMAGARPVDEYDVIERESWPAPENGTDAEVELELLLSWAGAESVLTQTDIALLRELLEEEVAQEAEVRSPYLRQARACAVVAARRGWSTRGATRRRRRLVERLSSAAPLFSAA